MRFNIIFRRIYGCLGCAKLFESLVDFGMTIFVSNVGICRKIGSRDRLELSHFVQ